MPDPETGTDSTTGATTPPGTAATPNDQTSTSAGETGAQPTPPGFSEDFLKGLDELDPSKVDPATLPKNFNERFVPKAEFTKKTQALAEERKRFEADRTTTFDAVRKIMEARAAQPSGPTPEEERNKELLELAAAGDGKALQELVRMEATRLVQPVQTQMALRTAAETAINANPYVKANWNQIISTIENDATLKEICTAQNYKYADKVMIALGLEIQARDLAGKFDASQKDLEAARAKITTLEKERTASLPSTTSRAGTSTGAPAPGRPTDFMDIAKEVYIKQGGREEDWR
jgi:hypothetical protein